MAIALDIVSRLRKFADRIVDPFPARGSLPPFPS
jgi:hypothetical protein